MTKDTLRLVHKLATLGFSLDDILALRRCSKTLQRWHELECGTEINGVSLSLYRDPETEKPFIRCQYWLGKTWQDDRAVIPDREASALRTIKKILSRYPQFTFYQQSDPRGCALYLIPIADAGGRSLDSCYSSVGVAVY